MNIKKKKMKRKKKTSTRKINKFQIKTFIFETMKKKPEEVDTPVNEFLRTANVKDKENIIIDQGDGYIRVSIIHKVKVDKV